MGKIPEWSLNYSSNQSGKANIQQGTNMKFLSYFSGLNYNFINLNDQTKNVINS
jgi:hypothetical protein